LFVHVLRRDGLLNCESAALPAATASNTQRASRQPFHSQNEAAAWLDFAWSLVQILRIACFRKKLRDAVDPIVAARNATLISPRYR
jgi:hypothetical protein